MGGYFGGGAGCGGGGGGGGYFAGYCLVVILFAYGLEGVALF